jgi:hypothetical protein
MREVVGDEFGKVNEIRLLWQNGFEMVEHWEQ